MAFNALIVDAHPHVRSGIELSLEPLGLTFVVADDPDQALSLARTATLHVIFLRVELPKSSGFMVCNKLRKDEKTRRIPIILYASTEDDDMFVQHAKLKTRADEYVRLPAGADTWRAAVRKLLKI